MGKHTLIGWSNSTINGSSGCDGCELWSGGDGSCYAAQVHLQRLALSLPDLYAPTFDEVRMILGRFQRAANWGPLTPDEWKDKPWFEGRPRHIFVGDMGDFLSRAVTDEFLKRELLGAITSKNGRRHVWQLLTKHPARLAELSEKWGGLPDNVIAMTTVTSQRTADLRIPDLLRVRCKWRGLSVEPLLEAVELNGHDYVIGEGLSEGIDWLTGKTSQQSSIFGGDTMPWLDRDCYDWATEKYAYREPRIHWVICGGESGPNARPMHPDWARSLRDQCKAAGVPFFFKQWGEHMPAGDCDIMNRAMWKPPVIVDEANMVRVGKRVAGRLLDGVEHSGMPEVQP